VGVVQSRLLMNVELKKEYRFEAAHFLPRVPGGHKCARMHGHSYRVELGLRGPVDPDTGWLIDFAAIDDAWMEMHRRFDHRTLNEVPGLENSTCENLAGYIWREVQRTIPQPSSVTVWETADACCVYRGD
jgi:6-pyruvoyltetrahydropterin/6-carboxytetrahydropterin synthase